MGKVLAQVTCSLHCGAFVLLNFKTLGTGHSLSLRGFPQLLQQTQAQAPALYNLCHGLLLNFLCIIVNEFGLADLDVQYVVLVF